MKKQKGSAVEAILILIVLFFLSVGGWIVKEYKCANYEDMTGMQTKYKIFDGCYVKTDKGWFLREQLRDISVGEGK